MRKKKILKVMGKMKTWSMNRKFFPQVQISIYLYIFSKSVSCFVIVHSDLPDFDEVDVTSPRSQKSRENASNFVRRNAWTRTSLRRSPATQ